MNDFKSIQERWNAQPEPKATQADFESLLTQVRAISKKQKIMNTVLGATILILVAFLVYVSGYRDRTFLTGISLMIGSLVLRIVVEAVSTRRLHHLDFLEGSTRFQQQLIRYYGDRRKIHFILTPCCMVLYCIGFAILLPLFKASLPYGFYLYILCSGIVFLLLLSVFILKQVRLELRKLRRLQQ